MSVRLSRRLLSLALLCVAAGTAGTPCEAARIEAVQGKSYTLGKQHGPWMIMVASFQTTAADGKTMEGKTPQQAAGDLVFELRQMGLPAYSFEVENAAETLQLTDRLGQEVRKKNLRRVKSTCVLAGNYGSYEDAVGQKTLLWLKKFFPKSLQEGITFTPTKTRPSPLSSAFLCVNPLLSAEELAEQAREHDPLLRQLNSGMQHSLLESNGEYTLMVAMFSGEQVTQLGDKKALPDILTENDLDIAGLQANELAVALRQDLDPNRRFRKLDAYVWHEPKRSIVTVGAFSSPNDPAIAQYMKLFQAARNPATGQSQTQYLAITGAPPKVWAFMPVPQLMKVPRLK
ncbi:MAG: hypothetical protein ACK5Q5_18155 [Planctomycetaceae bacterium]